MTDIDICPVCLAPVTCHREKAGDWEHVSVRYKAPCWIPVEERLPEVCDDVLVCSGARIDIGYYDGLWWETYTTRDIPTHWMPLPQPPKEE